MSLVLRLYKACIPPVVSYGCEIWGQLTIPAAMKRQRADLGVKHEQILCAILGIRSTTARSVLFTELEELPLSLNWLLRTVTFWNNMAALPDNSLFKTVALDNCRDAVLYKVKNWAWSFHQQLNKLGYEATLG